MEQTTMAFFSKRNVKVSVQLSNDLLSLSSLKYSFFMFKNCQD